MGQLTTQARIKNKAAIDSTAGVEDLALFDADGNPVEIGPPVLEVTVANAIGTVGKTTTTPEPAAGQLVAIKFTNGNTAETQTVAFNGGTARVIKLGGTASAAAKLTVAANGVALAYFDGTILHQVGVYS